ncbi:MAG: BrnT family toxin [Bacteroidota bacterium]|nr:BrnT family toxin [Bacteroidota bacterium]
MKIDYDPAKNAENIKERGLAFELAEKFNFESALVWQDVRNDYRELRVWKEITWVIPIRNVLQI